MLLFALFTSLLCPATSFAQIADASFFPSVKSINPSVAHMRRHGFVALDLSKKDVEKEHDVRQGPIQNGVQTEVELKKATLFRAGKGPGITFELLFDKENGEKIESMDLTSIGKRTTTNEASSTFYGGILDLKYFGLSIGKANYDYFYSFNVGQPPDVSARDIKQDLDYTNLKLGSAIKLGMLRFGAFLSSLKSSGEFAYTYYDPNTGNKGTTEKFPVTTSANGYGVGMGVSWTRLRMEASLERMYGNKMEISEDYPSDTEVPPPSSRMNLAAELMFTKIALGLRLRQIKGNFTDLEDIISSNLLYGHLTAEDTRLETTFNFGFGISKGFSFSGFYTQSTVDSQEKSPVGGNDIKFDAVTKSKAFGVNVSYVY